MNSPCWRNVPKDKTTDLTGWLSKRSRKCGLQSTSNPQLEGFNGSTWTPACSSQGTQAPSEPSRDQLPPPSASMVASGLTEMLPFGVSKCRDPSGSQPFH